MGKKVSVIMPAYKVEPYLRQCLDSVVNQTYRDLEIICIDDGSPDNCGKIMDEFAAKDERFVVVHKENEGLSAGWNQGMSLATGKWIAFVDTDDWVEPNYIEKLVEAAEKNDADVTIGSGYYICIDGKKDERTAPAELCRVYRNGEGAEKLQTRLFVPEKGRPYYSISIVWNKLYKREFIVHENLTFDNRLPAGYAHDVSFNFIVYGAAKTVYITANSGSGYNYRILNSSGSRKFKPDFPVLNECFLDIMYQYNEENNNASESIVKLLDYVSLMSIARSFRFCFFHPDNPVDRRTLAQDIARMKELPRYKHAIWQGKNPYLNKKQVILKYALRLPFLFPLELLYKANLKITDQF